MIGLGGVGDGIPREEHFVIIPASEVMAIVALASSRRISRSGSRNIIVGATAGKRCASPSRAGELKADGAMALLLKDAIRPNLVQTLEGGPAIRARGPFGNIAHGCNSVLATKTGARARRHRRHRSGLRLRPRRREILRHQMSHGRIASGGGGDRRDGALAQDARRRDKKNLGDGRSRRARARDCPISRSTSRTSRSSACP